LLQQNGYLLIRFLAEDIGKHLDTALDTILSAFSPTERRKLGFDLKGGFWDKLQLMSSVNVGKQNA